MTLTYKKKIQSVWGLKQRIPLYQENPANNGLVLAGFPIRDLGTKSPR